MIDDNYQWNKIKQSKKWKEMAENQKASEDKVHLKNFKDSSERSKDIVTRLYKNEICHSVQQTRKAE